jgi:hypothetical protein
MVYEAVELISKNTWHPPYEKLVSRVSRLILMSGCEQILKQMGTSIGNTCFAMSMTS